MSAFRRVAASLLLVLSAIACMGMGGFGEGAVLSKIPQPDRPFSVTVVDVTETSFTATDFSVEGKTLVPVELGKADISIDFAKIDDVMFLRDGEKITATVRFKGGDVKRVTVAPNTAFYGRTPWGLMRLMAKDIKELHF